MMQRPLEDLIEEVYDSALRGDAGTLDALSAELRMNGSDEAIGVALFAEACAARYRGDRERCVELFTESCSYLHDTNRSMHARVLMNLGRNYADSGEFEKAVSFFDQARHEYSQLGDEVGVARVDANQATMHQQLHEYDRSYDLLKNALHIFRSHGRLDDAAITLTNLSNTLVLTNRVDEALASVQEARSIYEERQDQHGLIMTLIRLVGLYQTLGEANLSLRSAEQALDLAQRASDPTLRAQVLGRMADILWQSGDFSRSIEFYQRELQEHESTRNVWGMARVHVGIGTVHWNLGDIPKALEHFHRTLELEESLPVQTNRAFALSNIGAVYVSMGDAARSIPYQLESLELHERSGILHEVADAHAVLAGTYAELGDMDSAMEHSKKAVDLNRQLKRYADGTFALLSLSAIQIKRGEYSEARSTMSELDMARIDSPMYRSMYHANLGKLLALEDEVDAAIEQYETALDICLSHKYRIIVPDLHLELRELSLKKNDLAGYVRHNEEYQRSSDELRGSKRAHQVATLEAERKIASERAERERERAILYSTLPQHIADRVIRGEQVHDHYDHAAIVFLDIVGFTALSSTLDSYRLASLLDDVFSVCDSICHIHGLTKIKTIGDSYLAAAFDAEHCAVHAARAAIAINDAITTITLPESTPDMPSVQVRLGIHCGPIFAGVIGKDRLQYDIWGDTVNIASRLESTCEPGRIHVSQQLADALTSAYEHGTWRLTLRGDIDLKGKGMTTTYWLEANT